MVIVGLAPSTIPRLWLDHSYGIALSQTVLESRQQELKVLAVLCCPVKGFQLFQNKLMYNEEVKLCTGRPTSRASLAPALLKFLRDCFHPNAERHKNTAAQTTLHSSD